MLSETRLKEAHVCGDYAILYPVPNSIAFLHLPFPVFSFILIQIALGLWWHCAKMKQREIRIEKKGKIEILKDGYCEWP